MLVILIFIYIQKAFILWKFLYTTKEKNQYYLCKDIFLSPSTESSVEQ